jgi:hypothetical protein
VPAHPRQLVHLIARLSAKKIGDTFVLFFNDVYRERRCSDREQKGMVLLGDAGEKAWRADAALSGEADEAARGCCCKAVVTTYSG